MSAPERGVAVVEMPSGSFLPATRTDPTHRVFRGAEAAALVDVAEAARADRDAKSDPERRAARAHMHAALDRLDAARGAS